MIGPRFPYFTGIFVSILVCFSVVGAQGQATSRVTGTVQDASGAVVPSAVVKLTNEATNVSVSTKTTS
jgi:hypothetical protein